MPQISEMLQIMPLPKVHSWNLQLSTEGIKMENYPFKVKGEPDELSQGARRRNGGSKTRKLSGKQNHPLDFDGLLKRLKKWKATAG